jgi:hypothetical protein
METTLQFSGGDVEKPTPTVATLCENAGQWLGHAQIHFAEGENLVDLEDLDGAIDQLATTVRKINTARLRLIEARQIRDGAAS